MVRSELTQPGTRGQPDLERGPPPGPLQGSLPLHPAALARLRVPAPRSGPDLWGLPTWMATWPVSGAHSSRASRLSCLRTLKCGQMFCTVILSRAHIRSSFWPEMSLVTVATAPLSIPGLPGSTGPDDTVTPQHDPHARPTRSTRAHARLPISSGRWDLLPVIKPREGTKMLFRGGDRGGLADRPAGSDNTNRTEGQQPPTSAPNSAQCRRPGPPTRPESRASACPSRLPVRK